MCEILNLLFRPPGVLPKGFYADRDADLKARGIAMKKRTLEEEMQDFQVSI